MESAGLSGRIEGFPVREVFRLICLSSRTGTLRLRSGDRNGRVDFDDGNIIRASTSEGYGNLGVVLLKHGKIRPESLEEVVEAQRKGEKHVPVGTLLVRAGHITRVDLEEALREQVQEVVTHLIRWQTGTFSFVGTLSPATDDIALDVSAVLLEAGINTRTAVLAALEAPGEIKETGTAPGRRPIVYVSERHEPCRVSRLFNRRQKRPATCTFQENVTALTDYADGEKGQPVLVIDLGDDRPHGSTRVLRKALAWKRRCPGLPALVLHTGLPAKSRRQLLEMGVGGFIDMRQTSDGIRIEMVALDQQAAIASVLGVLQGKPRRIDGSMHDGEGEEVVTRPVGEGKKTA
jgi:hypothetical protein